MHCTDCLRVKAVLPVMVIVLVSYTPRIAKFFTDIPQPQEPAALQPEAAAEVAAYLTNHQTFNAARTAVTALQARNAAVMGALPAAPLVAQVEDHALLDSSAVLVVAVLPLTDNAAATGAIVHPHSYV